MKEFTPKSPFTSVVDIIQSQWQSFPQEKLRRTLSLQKIWSQIVGPLVAQNSQVLYAKDNKLFIRVAHPTWHSELKLMQNVILEKIRELVPAESISELHIKVL